MPIVLKLDEKYVRLFEDAARRGRISVEDYVCRAVLTHIAKHDENNRKDALTLLRDGMDTTQTIKPKRKKAVFTPAETEAIYSDFVAFLNEALKAHTNTPFHCRYTLSKENLVEWLPPNHFSGESLEDNGLMRMLCSKKLFDAMESEDENLCFEVVRVAMDWGDVYYNRGVRKGNKTIVEKLHKDGELLPTIRRNYIHIKNRNLELLDYFTTGWSIIWYLLDMENLIIVSSRKVYALNKVLTDFQKQRGLDSIPACISFGQLVYQGNPRYIDGVGYIYNKNSKLIMYKKFIRVVGSLRALGDFTTSKEIDDLLFIMGEC